MGCFDIYCQICGGPFTSYDPKYYPEMTGIDTKWLNDAVIEYYQNNADTVYAQVSNYDGYGSFEDVDGVEHDIVEKQYNKEVKIYHSLCQGKQRKIMFNKYQQQHFDVDLLIKDNKATMLDKTYVMKN